MLFVQPAQRELWYTLCLAVAVAWGGARLSAAGGPYAAGKDERDQAERMEFMKRLIAAHQMYLGKDRELRLTYQMEPLLRYNDGVTRVPDAALFACTHEGRPEALHGLYLTARGVWVHEFQSLSLRGITAERDGMAVWSPQGAGVELRALDEAAPPAKNAAQRLVQMRGISREFTASVADPTSGRMELRLMPQPLLRYDQPGSGLLDGALFAFSKGTNPEVVLLVEARQAGSGHQWHYAFGRMSGRECEGRRKGEVIWSVPRAPRPVSLDVPYIEFAEPANGST